MAIVVRSRLSLALATLGVVQGVAACAPRPRVGGPGPGDGPPGGRRAGVAAPMTEMTAIWRQMGLLTPTGDLPFVAAPAYFARSGDSTLVVLAVSFANRALSFAREGDRYRAPYQVRLEVRRDGTLVRQLASDEVVRVATFRETARTDESVLFTQALVLAPGRHALTLAVRDAGAGRSGVVEATLDVPRLGPGSVSTPVLAYETAPRLRLDTLPRYVASPRAAVTFGQDSIVPVYVESYGAQSPTAPARVTLVAAVRADREVVWRDTVTLERRAPSLAAAAAAPLALYSGVLRVPVARAGIGVVRLDVTRPAEAGAPADSSRAALFVSLGDELPIASFEEMLGYLRFYATPERLKPLRDASPEGRAAAWAAFLRETDPAPGTTQHEGLQEYFARLRQANTRFREDALPGWQTDRGQAYLAFGEPDQIFDPNGPDQNVRGRTQVWEYRDPRVTLVFTDQSGFGRWRLNPAGQNEVQAQLRRRMVK